ncbi:MAG: hypothetical protein LBO82_06445 [Synergistaceae bacterium]|jgi:hypothetical protein|nr:hypothetical protein [Synergistaceae bacterium]
MPVQLDTLFAKKAPASAQGLPGALSWEIRVPMLTNPLFMLDAAAAFFLAWFLPSVLAAAFMVLGGFDSERILFAVSWIGMSVGLLAILAFFLILVRFRNAYYARYTLTAAGIACETSPDAPLSAGAPARTEKWVTWDRIRRVRGTPALRTVTLLDSFLPVFRLFCPDDAAFAKALEFCKERAEQGTRPLHPI